MTKFNIGAINCCTEIEGPFKRLAIWFQGCDINCNGCCNKSLQPLEPKNIVSLQDLINIISDAKEKYNIEGVTYLGGEPTLQHFLPLLTSRIHELGLGVISYTGKKYDDVKDMLSGCDLVIDGEFIKEKLDKKRRIIGSTNQNIICLTERYADVVKWYYTGNKKMEFNVSDNILANGDPL